MAFPFRPYLVDPAWTGRVKEKGCQHRQHLYLACPCPKAGQERSYGEEHLLTAGLLSAILCPFHSLLDSHAEGPRFFVTFPPPCLILTKPSLNPPDPHHDKSPTCPSHCGPSSKITQGVAICARLREQNLGGRVQEKWPYLRERRLPALLWKTLLIRGQEPWVLIPSLPPESLDNPEQITEFILLSASSAAK